MTTLIVRVFAVTAIVLLLGRRAPAAESVSVLLQKAIYAEETEGNLESAIKLYEQIASDADGNRPFVAQAKYRLAVCYQKQGRRDQAVSILNELIRLSPADAAVSQKARLTLAELGQPSASTPRIQKLALDGTALSVSPDGRYLAYRPSPTPNTALIFETATGKQWPVAREQTSRVLTLVFSHDGRRIAYTAGGASAVFVSDVDGANAREVFRINDSDDGANPWLIDWMPNGREVAALYWSNTADNAGLIDVNTGALKTLKSGPSGKLGAWYVSPNGRYMIVMDGPRAYWTHSILSVESGHAEPIAQKNLLDVAGWAPGGDRLLFVSDRSGTRDLWAVAVKEGKTVGEAELIRRNWSDGGTLGVAADGTMYISKGKHSADIYLADVDLRTGEKSGEPKRLTDRFPGQQTQPRWSKDGESILFVVPEQSSRLVSVSTATDTVREFPRPRNLRNEIKHYSGHEESGSLVVASWDLLAAIHRYDLATGHSEEFAGTQDFWCPEITPDGRTLFYVAARTIKVADKPDAYAYYLGKRDLGSNQDTVVLEPINNWTRIRLSPDGKKLAVPTRQPKEPRSTIKILDLEAGSTREYPQPTATLDSVAWTADGARLVYSSRGMTDPRMVALTNLWSMDIATGKVVRLNLARADVTDIAVHPNGRQIAFRAGPLKDGAEVWALEGFLGPKPATPEKSPSTFAFEVPLDEISGPDHTFVDAKYGVRGVVPADWLIRDGSRHNEQENSIGFVVPDAPEVWARLYYRMNYNGAKSNSADDIDAWMRAEVDRVAQNRMEQARLVDYRIRAASLTSRRIDGRAALSWMSDFTRRNEKWVECQTLVHSEKGFARFFMQGPAEKIAPLLPAFDGMISTVHLP